MLKREQRATLLLLSSNDESQTKMFPLPPRLYDKWWWCGSSNEKGSLQGIFATKTSKGRKKGKQYCILDGEPLKKQYALPKLQIVRYESGSHLYTISSCLASLVSLLFIKIECPSSVFFLGAREKSRG